jgi:hypothetical protein
LAGAVEAEEMVEIEGLLEEHYNNFVAAAVVVEVLHVVDKFVVVDPDNFAAVGFEVEKALGIQDFAVVVVVVVEGPVECAQAVVVAAVATAADCNRHTDYSAAAAQTQHLSLSVAAVGDTTQVVASSYFAAGAAVENIR